MLHKTIIIGTLGRDVEIKEVNGKPLAQFDVVVDGGYYDKQNGAWVDRPIWYKCTCWKEVKPDRFKKGAKVYFEGEPKPSAYINKSLEPTVDNALAVHHYKILYSPK
jgi:single-stranded DNA-binding protein